MKKNQKRGVENEDPTLDDIFLDEARKNARRKRFRDDYEYSRESPLRLEETSTTSTYRDLSEFREFERAIVALSSRRGGDSKIFDSRLNAHRERDIIDGLTSILNKSILFQRIENHLRERLLSNDSETLEANDCRKLVSFEEPYLLGSWRAFNVRDEPFLFYRLIVEALLRIEKHAIVTSRLLAFDESSSNVTKTTDNEKKKATLARSRRTLSGTSSDDTLRSSKSRVGDGGDRRIVDTRKRRERENTKEKRLLSTLAKNIVDKAKIDLANETRCQRESDNSITLILRESTEYFGDIIAKLNLTMYDVKLCAMQTLCAKLSRAYSSWSAARESTLTAESRKILSEEKVRRNLLRDKVHWYERERRIRESEALRTELKRIAEEEKYAILEKSLVETLSKVTEELETARQTDIEWTERYRTVKSETEALIRLSIDEREAVMARDLETHRAGMSANIRIRETEIENIRSSLAIEEKIYAERLKNFYKTTLDESIAEKRFEIETKEDYEDYEDDVVDRRTRSRLVRDESAMNKLIDFAKNLLKTEKSPSNPEDYTSYDKIWRWNSFVRHDVFAKFLSIVDGDEDTLTCNLSCSALREKWQHLINDMNKFHRLSITKQMRYNIETEYREKVRSYDKWRNDVTREISRIKNSSREQLFDRFTDPRYRSYSRTTLYRISNYNLPWADLSDIRLRFKDSLSFQPESTALKYLTLCLSANLVIDPKVFANCAFVDETLPAVRSSPSESATITTESRKSRAERTIVTGLLTTSSSTADSGRGTPGASTSFDFSKDFPESSTSTIAVDVAPIAPDQLRSFAKEEIDKLNERVRIEPENWRCLGILYLLSKAAAKITSDPTVASIETIV